MSDQMPSTIVLAKHKLTGLTIARAIVLTGAIMVGLVVASSHYSRQSFIQHRVGGEHYQNIINGHDLIADYLPPPLLPFEAFMMVHETADTVGVNLDRQIVRWKELHTQFDERLKFWDAKMAERPFLEPDQWITFRDGINKYGKIFWDKIENELIPAFKKKDEAQVHATISSLTSYYRQFLTFVSKQDKFVLQTVTRLERDSLDKSGRALTMGTLIAAFVGALITLIVLACHRYVVRALTKISAVMTTLATGNLDVAIPFESRKDEVGEMARALTVFKQQAQVNYKAKSENEYVIKTLGAGLEKLSHGDLTHKIDDPFPAVLDVLRVRFNQTALALQGIIANVRSGTEGIRSGASEISLASDDLSRRTENQAANLEQTAAAVAEITSKVKQAASGAAHARSVVSQTKHEADHSGAVMSRAVTAMRQIESTSQKIMQIIGVMDEIAFQTNLLALNAGVEAARAGDAGRGFAVVASEVRALAQRSTDAAKEIKTLLSSSQTVVDQGATLVAETGSSLQVIIQRISEINTIVNEIAENAEYQANGLHEVNTAVEQMDQVTQQNAAMVEETTAATRTLTEQSAELAQLVAHFTVAAGASNTKSQRNIDLAA